MISKKQAVLLTVVVLIVAYPFVPLHYRGVDPASAKNAVVIDVWHPWSDDTRDEFVSVVEQFNARHPGIIVRAVHAPDDMANATRFFTSVAGGKPPDIALVDGPQVAAWADLGLLPLDDFYAKAHLAEADFWPPTDAQTATQQALDEVLKTERR